MEIQMVEKFMQNFGLMETFLSFSAFMKLNELSLIRVPNFAAIISKLKLLYWQTCIHT